MRTLGKILIVLFMVSLGTNAGAKSPTPTPAPPRIKKESRASPPTTSKEVSMKPICEPEIIGLVLSSILRLTRNDLVGLTPRWGRAGAYKFGPKGDSVQVKYADAAAPEEIDAKDAVFSALMAERRFLRDLAAKKLPKDFTAKVSILNKLQFEVNPGEEAGGRNTDEYKWTFEYNETTYSFGLQAPLTSNTDMAVVYRPMIPHCSIEKVEEFKNKYEPFSSLWANSGILSGEQDTALFKIFNEISPDLAP